MPEKRSKTLGDVIRDARVAAKKGLREFSRELGITPSYQSDIENDRRVPAEDVLQKIAAVLDLNFDDLMARAGRFGEQAERYMRRTRPRAHSSARSARRTSARSNSGSCSTRPTNLGTKETTLEKILWTGRRSSLDRPERT